MAKSVRRKNVVHFQPPTREGGPQVQLSGWWYAGCTSCGLRTATSAVHGVRVCQDCSTLGPYGRPLWDREGDPKACCLTSSTLISDPQVLQNFRCGGDTPWWLCSGCHRAHPYDPSKTRAAPSEGETP